MKLLQQTGRYFLLFSSLAFLVAGIVLFFMLRLIISEELDESLVHARGALHQELSNSQSAPSRMKFLDQLIEIQVVTAPSDVEIFADTLLWNDGEGELEPYRKYSYTDAIGDKFYHIRLHQSRLENEDLLTAIAALLFGLLFCFLVVVNLFNRYLSARMWKPFYQMIRQVQGFNVSKAVAHQPIASNIDEFQALDQALQQMTRKIRADYLSLKQFSENASHEIQTPLAIIRAQAELLLQNDIPDEKNLRHLQQIQQATDKLSRLNQSLLLLTRIGNRQFEQTAEVNLKELIEQKLDAIEPLIANKSLLVKTDLEVVTRMLNPVLADILLSNLIGNAIKHNLQEGKIEIYLRKEKLIVKNTGKPLNQAPANLFERFRKADDATKSLGLGLSIVKEICVLYDWGIQYQNEGKWHMLTINWEKRENDRAVFNRV